MRFLGILLLCALSVGFAFETDASTFSLKWANAFQSFFPGSVPGIATTSEHTSDSLHARVKRAIYAAMGWGITCNPGFTGQYCEIPICYDQGSVPTSNMFRTQTVEKIDLGEACPGTVYFPVESRVRRLTVSVTTKSGSPSIQLVDNNNIIVSTVGTITPTNGIFYVENPPPGQYSLNVTLTSGTSFLCRVDVEVESQLSVYGGFVRSPHGDDFENEALYSGEKSYFIAHLDNIVSPGSPGAVSIRTSERGFVDYVAPLNKRYGCSYEYYAGQYSCQSGGTFYAFVVEGTDGDSNHFRRLYPFYCLNSPIPTPSPRPSASPVPDACLNGGTLVHYNNTIPFCYCGELYTGNDCARRVCMNNGVATFDGCDCKSGFSGDFCEHVNCGTDQPGAFETDQKTLIVVIRKSRYMASKVNDMARVISDQINYHGVQGANVYSNFILVTFSNDDITWLDYPTSDLFLKDLTSLNQTNANTNCSDTIVDAIDRVFNVEFINNKSPILVFTDVVADDEADYLQILHRNTWRKLPIFLFFMPDPSNSCAVDTMSPGYRTLYYLGHISGGIVLSPQATDFQNALKYTMRSVTYKRQMVLGYDYYQCSMGNHGSFFADSTVKDIVILATGTNLSISITDPTGNQSTVIDVLVSDNKNFIWKVAADPVIVGQYLFFISSMNGASAPCSYRVYVQSDFDLFYGIADSLLSDVIFSEPVYNMANNMVVTMNGLRNFDVDRFRLFAEMQISRSNGSGHLEPVYYSNGVWRDNCNFHLHFGAFTCKNPNEHLYMTVFADDNLGFPIQRTSMVYCAYFQPTTAPPGTCQNGGATNPSNTTQCICPPNWRGQYCDQIVCANNATAVANQYCQCPPGVSGRYCERLSCINAATGVDFSFTHRSLTLVLNVRKTMAAPLADIVNSIQVLVDDLFIMHNRWITSFTVIVYNGTMVQKVKTTPEPRAFIAAVHYAAEMAVGQPDVTDCRGQLDSAIKMAVDESLANSFIFAFTDAESNDDDLTYVNAMLNAQDQRIQINLVAVSNNICNATNGYQFSPQHIEMVEFTEGDLFYTTHPGTFLSYIPTLFKSGLFGGGNSQTCNITRYLPVDGWTQAFTIYSGGQNLKVSVTPPGANPNEALYLNEIDTDTYLDIRQYIIPCDQSSAKWQAKHQYCYSFEQNKVSWTDAHTQCHYTREASMLHIYNQPTQDDINLFVGTVPTWIGLKRLGNVFVWDTPNNANINLTQTGYTNWDPSANQNDPTTGDCVVLKPGTDGQQRWFTAPCQSNYTTMCMKHRYNQAFTAGRDENLLPAGLWKLSLTGNGPCGFAARIQSEIQVFYGFTNDLHSDEPTPMANIAAKNNRIIAKATALESIGMNTGPDGNLDYGMMYVNETLLRTVTFQPRSLCAYTSVSQTFTCPPYGSNKFMAEMPLAFNGIDQFGNLFQRIATPYCSQTVVTCQHDGYLVDGECLCPPFFEGKVCETRKCFNGGELMPNGQCRCTEETEGESCELFRCVPPRKHDFTDTGKTLAILVETSFLMTTAVRQLAFTFESLIQTTLSNTDSKWFTNYILVPFDSTSNRAQWYNKTYATDPGTIATALKAIPPYKCPGQACESGTKCPRPLLSVLNDTLNDPQFVSPNSVVLMITRSTVEDISMYSSIYQSIQRTKAQVQIIIPDSSSPCSLPWSDPSNRVLFSIPQTSGGNLFTVYSHDMVSTLLPQYMPSLFRGSVIDSLLVRNCTQDTVYLSIDSFTSEFTIVYSGVNPSITITDPLNTTTSMPANVLSSDFTYFGVVKTRGRGGTYKISATSNSAAGACLINVHASSNIEVFAGFVVPNDPYYGATSDEANYVAIADPEKMNVVLLHANNLGNGQLNYVQVYSSSGGRRAHLWTGEVYPRSRDCSYEYYSVGGFRCNAEQTYELAVYGIDAKGFIFRRSMVVHCVSDLPPRPPTPPTCDLSNRYYDILLILDGNGKNDFSVVQNLMTSTFSGYTLNSNSTRLSVIVVNSDANVVNLLKDSDGKMATQVIGSATTNGNTGQNLAAALSKAITEYSDPTSSGYRNDARHLIVYATQNAIFTQGDPGDILLGIKRGGMFGFVGVGYELNANSANNLVNLAGQRCSYVGSGQNGALYIANFIQDLTCFRRPVCGE